MCSTYVPLAGKKGWWDEIPVDSLPEAVTSREEVRPMNAVWKWVLPLFVTVGRLT
jgi:hypothetical protein